MLGNSNGCATYKADSDVFYQNLKMNTGVFIVQAEKKQIILFNNGVSKNDMDNFFLGVPEGYSISTVKVGESVNELDDLDMQPIDILQMSDGDSIYRYKNRFSNTNGTSLKEDDIFWNISEINYLDIYVHNRIIQTMKVRFLMP